MLYEDNYLAHHGIKGQRWGVRRYQNEDGSYTEEGKKRRYDHLSPRFMETEKSINQRLSNAPRRFVRKPMSVEEVKKRGNLTDKEAFECCYYAKEIFNRASKIEPGITKDVVNAVSKSGSKMYGLENRLKQPSSIASKIGSDAKEKDISFEEASNSIRDAIRYTSVSDDDLFVRNYFSSKSELERLGYKELRCKNYFDLYKKREAQHKAVQCVYSDSKGNVFEIQFQTPSSQAAKELKTPIYEKRRSLGLNKKEMKELERQMRELAEYVPYPNDVLKIKSHG